MSAEYYLNKYNPCKFIYDQGFGDVTRFLLAETGMRPDTIFTLSRFNFSFDLASVEFVEPKTDKTFVRPLSAECGSALFTFFQNYSNFSGLFYSYYAMRRYLKYYFRFDLVTFSGKNCLYLYRYIFVKTLIDLGLTDLQIQDELQHTEMTVTQKYINNAQLLS
jgi:hypothetical protein